MAREARAEEYLTTRDRSNLRVGETNGYAHVEATSGRVLAECEAKRRIVAWHRMINGLDTEDRPVLGCGNCIASGAVPPYIIAGPCMTVRLLALPHADHPDYREEWRP